MNTNSMEDGKTDMLKEDYSDMLKVEDMEQGAEETKSQPE